VRLLDIDEEKFWQFRRLNEDEIVVGTQRFQEVGAWIEQQLFNLE
jgi:hypothetical protein